MEQITLDLIPKGSLPVLHASQYDDGRQWKVNLKENGEDYTLTNETIVLGVRKGDGCAVTCAVAIESGKKYVILTSTEQMCAVAGQNLAELQITKDNTKIGTLNFILQVERDPLAAGISSGTEIHDLQHQVDECVHTAFETIGASGLPYDNTESGLTADNVQQAIDEVNEKASSLPSYVYTKEETDALIADKADKATLEADYYDKAETDALLDDKADASAFGDYYTKSETNTKLSGKADKGSVYTTAQVNTLLGDKADKSDLDNYYTKSQANSLLNDKANKANVYDKNYINDVLGQIDNAFTDVNTALGQKANSSDVYNKAYIDTALSAKANANAVYTKAETDAKVGGLIDDETTANNKTWSSNKISEELEALLPVNSTSGAVANFETSLTLPLVSVKAAIVATQEAGTPTPQSPKAISGVSAVNVVHCHKNLFQYDENNVTTGTTTTSITRAYYPLGFKGVSSLTFSAKLKSGSSITTSDYLNIGKLRKSDGLIEILSQLITPDGITTRTLSISSDDEVVLTSLENPTVIKSIMSRYDLQIEVGSTATTYEPYNGNTTLISLGNTYYGGEFSQDKNGGRKFKITWCELTDLGSLGWGNAANGRTGCNPENIKLVSASSIVGNLMSDCYVSDTHNNVWNRITDKTICITNNPNARMLLYDSDLENKTSREVKEALTGRRVIYELAEPFTVDLPDGEPITAFNGVNNVWSDSGDTTVEYKQSIQEYIDAKLGNNNRGVNLLSLSAPADDLQRDEPDERSER